MIVEPLPPSISNPRSLKKVAAAGWIAISIPAPVMSSSKSIPASASKKKITLAAKNPAANPSSGITTRSQEKSAVKGEAQGPAPAPLGAQAPLKIIIKPRPRAASEESSIDMPDLQTVSDSSASESPSAAPSVEKSQTNGGYDRGLLVSTLERATLQRAKVEGAVDVPTPAPGAELSAVGLGDRGTPTPSLASLLDPPPTEGTNSHASVKPSFDSITAALLAQRGPDARIFITLARDLDLHDEDIEASLLRYHPAYDPQIDDDPLLPYGAVDGILPGKTSEESMILRDVVMRWCLQHRNWNWDDLETGVREFYNLRVTTNNLTTYEEEGYKTYTLGTFHLELIAQLTLAVHQVLDGLYKILNTPVGRRFEIDPGWQFLRMMEENTSRTSILMAFSSLQFRLLQSVKHIKRNLNSIKIVYGQNALDSVSTINSTRSSVRSNFGRDEPPVELAKILARPDYGSRAFDPEARAWYVSQYGDGERTQFTEWITS